MSWLAYVTNLETSRARCGYGAIIGRNPICFWAESADKSKFPITIEDIGNIVRAITSQDQSIMASGFKIGSKISVTCLRLEPDLLIGQGKGEHKNYSIVVALTGQAVIIGVNYDADIKASIVLEIVGALQDHLKTCNY